MTASRPSTRGMIIVAVLFVVVIATLVGYAGMYAAEAGLDTARASISVPLVSSVTNTAPGRSFCFASHFSAQRTQQNGCEPPAASNSRMRWSRRS